MTSVKALCPLPPLCCCLLVAARIAGAAKNIFAQREPPTKNIGLHRSLRPRPPIVSVKPSTFCRRSPWTSCARRVLKLRRRCFYRGANS
jgi:hypothetical protein